MENTKSKKNIFIPSMLLTLVLILICGLIYPLVVTGISQLVMHDKADGSLIYVDGKAVGSEIVGQLFTEPYFLHSRPSAVSYNTFEKGETSIPSSGANNYGASNPLLKERMAEQIDALLKENPNLTREDIPIDMISQSGSGLDPHISKENAALQVDRIVAASGLDRVVVESLIEKNTEGKSLGFIGQERVNVLKTNLDIALEMKLIENYEL